MYKNIEIITEIKTESPFGFKSDKTWEDLFTIANAIGDIISVHTDPRWGGSFELLEKARALTKKPILAKGIHATDQEIERALQIGADWVLVVGRIPEVQIERCLIEPLTLEDLKSIPSGMRVVWNTRDLADGSQKSETFEQARVAWSGWLCQASNIRTVADIKEGANAVLVGSAVDAFKESLSG